METEQSEKNDTIAGDVASGNNERNIFGCDDSGDKSDSHKIVTKLMSQLQNIWTPPLSDRKMRNPVNISAKSIFSKAIKFSGDGEIGKASETAQYNKSYLSKNNKDAITRIPLKKRPIDSSSAMQHSSEIRNKSTTKPFLSTADLHEEKEDPEPRLPTHSDNASVDTQCIIRKPMKELTRTAQPKLDFRQENLRLLKSGSSEFSNSQSENRDQKVNLDSRKSVIQWSPRTPSVSNPPPASESQQQSLSESFNDEELLDLSLRKNSSSNFQQPPLSTSRQGLQRSTVPSGNILPARSLQPPPPYTPRHVGFQLRTLRAPTLPESHVGPNMILPNTDHQQANSKNVLDLRYPTFLEPKGGRNTNSVNRSNQRSDSVHMARGRRYPKFLKTNVAPNAVSPNTSNHFSNSMNRPEVQRYSTLPEPNVGSKTTSLNTLHHHPNSINVLGYQRYSTFLGSNMNTNIETPNMLNQFSNSKNIIKGRRHPTFLEPNIGSNTASSNKLNKRLNSINEPGGQRHHTLLEPNIGPNTASSNSVQRSNSINTPGGQRRPTFLEPKIGPNTASTNTLNQRLNLTNKAGGPRHPTFLEPNAASTNTLYQRLNPISMLENQGPSRSIEPNVDPSIASSKVVEHCLNSGDQTHPTYLKPNIGRHTTKKNSFNQRSNALRLSGGIFCETNVGRNTSQLNTLNHQLNEMNMKYPSNIKPNTIPHETNNQQLNSMNMPITGIYSTFFETNAKATSQNPLNQRPNLINMPPIRRYPAFSESNVKLNTTQQHTFNQQLNSMNISMSQKPSRNQLKDPHLSNYTHFHPWEIENPVRNSPSPTEKERKSKPKELKSINNNTQSQSKVIGNKGRPKSESQSHEVEIESPLRYQSSTPRVEKMSEQTNSNENTHIHDLSKLKKQNFQHAPKTETVTSNAGHILDTNHLLTNQTVQPSKNVYDSEVIHEQRELEENPRPTVRMETMSRPTTITKKIPNENTEIKHPLKIEQQTIREVAESKSVTSNATGTLETHHLVTDQNRQSSTSFPKNSYKSKIDQQRPKSDTVSFPAFGIDKMSTTTISKKAKKNTDTRRKRKKSKKRSRDKIKTEKMTSNKSRILKTIYKLGKKKHRHSTNSSKKSNGSKSIQQQHEPGRITPPTYRIKSISGPTKTIITRIPNENTYISRHSKKTNKNIRGESKTETVTSNTSQILETNHSLADQNVQPSAGSSKKLYDSEMNQQPRIPDKIPLSAPRIKKITRPTKTKNSNDKTDIQEMSKTDLVTSNTSETLKTYSLSTNQNLQVSTGSPKNLHDSEIYQQQVDPVEISHPTPQIEKKPIPTTMKISIKNNNFQEHREITEHTIREVSETKSVTSNTSENLKIYNLLTNQHHQPSSAKNSYESQRDRQQHNVVVEKYEGDMNKGNETDEMKKLFFSNLARISENRNFKLTTTEPITHITVSIQPEKTEKELSPSTNRGTDGETGVKTIGFNTIALLETKLRFQLVLAIPENPPREADVPSLESVIDVLKNDLHNKGELTLEDVLRIYYRDEKFCDELVDITTKLLWEVE